MGAELWALCLLCLAACPHPADGVGAYEPSGNKEEEPLPGYEGEGGDPTDSRTQPATEEPTSPRNATIVVSDIMDLIIAETILQLDSAIEVDDIDEDFQWKILGNSKIKGLFKSTNGSIRDMKTITRTGEVMFITSPDNVKLSASLGVKMLELSYENYLFKLGSQNVSTGSISVSCKKNSISIVVTLLHKPDTHEYTLELDRVNIDILHGLTAKILDKNGRQDRLQALANWILKNFDKPITGALNKQLRKALRRSISKININNELADLIPNPNDPQLFGDIR